MPESGQGVTVAACRLALFLLGAVTRDLSRGVFRARPDLHGEVEERNKYISFPVERHPGGPPEASERTGKQSLVLWHLTR